MSPDEYLAKAALALDSAAALLARNDFEGAVNRAYYAMFHAARGAIASHDIEIRSRKHRTLIGQFSRHFVVGGSLPRALGRAINEVQKLRHFGDYDAPAVAREDAEHALASAREFVTAIQRMLRSKP